MCPTLKRRMRIAIEPRSWPESSTTAKLYVSPLPVQLALLEIVAGFRLAVRLRDHGQPADDLRVLAGSDDRRRILCPPGPKRESVGAKLHRAILETRRAALSDDPCEANSAATYSPGRLPSEYHRRWRA